MNCSIREDELYGEVDYLMGFGRICERSGGKDRGTKRVPLLVTRCFYFFCLLLREGMMMQDGVGIIMM